MEIVYATGSAVVALPNGSRFRVAKGSHWPADDPIVRAQPSLFSADSRYGLTFSTEPAEYAEGAVEQTTNAPGEKRNVRRG
jgi:hypothetical protein